MPPQDNTQRFPFVSEGGSHRPRHRTVDRIAAILEHVARAPEPQGLSDIATAIGAPVSSAQSLVNGLTAAGYLQERGRGFALGLAPYLLSTVAGRRPIEIVTHDMLEDIVSRTGYIAVLAVLVGNNVYYVDYAASDPSFEYLAQNKLRRPPLETSSGWALLAGLDPDTAWDMLLDHQLTGGTNAEISADLLNRFQREYPVLRETGEVIAPGIAQNGADGVAIAVKEHGRVVAAVAVIAAPDQIARDAHTIIAALRDARRRWEQ
ncbi:helix-turn-helix domain-containing protein [Corynebacterium sp. zg254]|uniref:Helix-turn-helix domain-containing protein n=1 Tax=Corynebacterium zhongnanshanii TaxID=2768834 RepID=A0ABQ6VCI4_9CORY|nr:MULTISPECIES: helix-turn-helix domain-containing protein [Corynebacterium]KAB3519926.1 helix-turn-helix domain-containing protein [Corynebacterium zhongnanshanii]MCR5914874.1 helix-turn-helix domain-containing protein [Corynebacterium sp. zg254]